MSQHLETLAQKIGAILGERVVELKNALGELTLTVRAADYSDFALILRDHAELKLEQLIDLCGVDYSTMAKAVMRAHALRSSAICCPSRTTSGCV